MDGSVGVRVKREGQKKLKKKTRWQGNKGENTGTVGLAATTRPGSELLSLSSLVRGLLLDQGLLGARPAPLPPPVTCQREQVHRPS